MVKLLDAVPSVVWAGLVVALSIAVGALAFSRLSLIADVALAKQATSDAVAELDRARASVATKVAEGLAKARQADKALFEGQERVIHELQSDKAGRDDRVRELERRLRNLARPFACAGGGGNAASADAAGGGHGVGDTGLRGLDGQDLVVVDAEARAELGRLAVAGREVGKTLVACRGLLRQAWRASNE
jgi:hypothetical protein